jgi:hypothetical protein
VSCSVDANLFETVQVFEDPYLIKTTHKYYEIEYFHHINSRRDGRERSNLANKTPWDTGG